MTTSSSQRPSLVRAVTGHSGGRARVGLVAGPVMCVAMLLLAPPEGMTLAAWRTAAVAALMAVWWITEALPIAATALAPIVLFPLLEIASIGETTAPFANPVIYLFLGLPFAWIVLTRWLHPVGNEPVAGGAAMIRDERARQGPISRAEWTVGVITALTATAWVIRPLLERQLPAISDAGIAIAGALLMFAVPLAWRPLRVVLTWKQAERLPWAVLLLFGGGLSLAAAIQSTGLAEWIGLSLGVLSGWPIFVVILVITTVMIFLTELTSNTASAAAFLPVVAALAIGIGADPLQLTLPTALAASCAFMLPVATPPNAIVYGTGRLTIPQMAAAGLWLNLFFAALIPVVVFLLAARVFGV